MKKKTVFKPRGCRPWVLGALLVGAPGLAAAGPTIPYGDEGFLTVNYALQIWHERGDHISAEHSGSSSDTFLRRNRVTFTGQYNDYFGFYAQLEAGNDSRRGNDERGIYYRDAYVTFDYSDEIRVLAGRFKNTFSRENLEACLEPLTLDRGMLGYTPFAGTRDTGIALWGNLADGMFQYRLMLADGREGDHVAKSAPRTTARVHFSPLDPEFDYGYRGTYLGTRTVFTLGAAYDWQPSAAFTNYPERTGVEPYEAVTLDAFLEVPTSKGTFTASAATFEYTVGNAINQDPDPTLPLNTELEGHYIKAGYLLPNRVGMGRLQLFARQDTAEYNLAGGMLDNVTTAYGFNYYIDGQNLKLTGEYASVSFDNPDPDNVMLQDHSKFILGFQLIF